MSLLSIELQMCIMAWHSSWKKEITRYLSPCFPPKDYYQDIYHHGSPDSGKPMKQVEDERFLSSAAAKHSINSISPFLPTLSYLICSFTIPVPFHQYTFSLPLSWFKTLLTNIFWLFAFWTWLFENWLEPGSSSTTKPLLRVDANVVLSSWCQK